MSFRHLQKKGLSDYLVDGNLADDCMSIHISEAPAGKSSHEPHIHAGVESYYVFQGELTISLGAETLRLVANQAASIDSGQPHKVTNTGSAANRYMVIIARAPAQPGATTGQ